VQRISIKFGVYGSVIKLSERFNFDPYRYIIKHTLDLHEVQIKLHFLNKKITENKQACVIYSVLNFSALHQQMPNCGDSRKEYTKTNQL
jgi:hypothetical protein